MPVWKVVELDEKGEHREPFFVESEFVSIHDRIVSITKFVPYQKEAEESEFQRNARLKLIEVLGEITEDIDLTRLFIVSKGRIQRLTHEVEKWKKEAERWEKLHNVNCNNLAEKGFQNMQTAEKAIKYLMDIIVEQNKKMFNPSENEELKPNVTE